jgi:outer membrane protein TolC
MRVRNRLSVALAVLAASIGADEPVELVDDGRAGSTSPSPSTRSLRQTEIAVTPQRFAATKASGGGRSNDPAAAPRESNDRSANRPVTTPPILAGSPSGMVELVDDGLPPTDVVEIDLPTALELASARNAQVQFARERIREAQARHLAARSLWLPSVRGGVTWSRHQGTLQDSSGRIRDTERQSLQTGLGAAAFAAGPPMIPGVAADFHVADALTQPHAALRQVCARRETARAADNDALFETARAYVELLRARLDRTVAREALGLHETLATLTAEYARTGTGLQADADRVRTEFLLRRNDLERASEEESVVAARLARLLRLDPGSRAVPVDTELVPLELVDPGTDLAMAIERAKRARPEVLAGAHEREEARARLTREKLAPLVPTVSLGAGVSEFGGSGGGFASSYGDRTDLQAIVWWQLRGLGVGEVAARRERQSQMKQLAWRQQAIEDLVAEEVTAAWSRRTLATRRIEPARAAVEEALQSLRRNLERIRGGQGLPIESLQSIQALASARRELIRTLAEVNIAEFALQRAMGDFLR